MGHLPILRRVATAQLRFHIRYTTSVCVRFLKYACLGLYLKDFINNMP